MRGPEVIVHGNEADGLHIPGCGLAARYQRCRGDEYSYRVPVVAAIVGLAADQGESGEEKALQLTFQVICKPDTLFWLANSTSGTLRETPGSKRIDIPAGILPDGNRVHNFTIGSRHLVRYHYIPCA